MTQRHFAYRLTVCLMLVAVPNCTTSLPRHAWRGVEPALQTMVERESNVQSFSSTCRLLLQSSRGDVELSGVLIARPPHYVRLRASKLSQTIFDLTLTPDGLFVLDRSGREAQESPTHHLTRDGLIGVTALLPGFASNTEWEAPAPADGQPFTRMRNTGDDGTILSCTVDRDTLTTDRCNYLDDEGAVRQSISFDSYQAFGDVVWPMRITGTGTGGSFEILFRNVEINPELPARAFVPSRRAIKQP